MAYGLLPTVYGLFPTAMLIAFEGVEGLLSTARCSRLHDFTGPDPKKKVPTAIQQGPIAILQGKPRILIGNSIL